MARERDTHRCIVCDKALAKRTTTLWFRAPVPPLVPDPAKPWERHHAHPGKADGHIDRSPGITTFYLTDLPKTKADVQRFSNGTIIRAPLNDQGYIGQATIWDGESYVEKFFCSTNCAVKQSTASAHRGDRFRWSK
jgi:hypothetical protein